MIWRARFWRDNTQIHEVIFTCASKDDSGLSAALDAAIAGQVIKAHDAITVSPRGEK